MTKNFGSIGAFVSFLRTRQEAVRMAERHGLEEAGEFLRDSAKSLIGTEDEFWPDLAESTVTEKERLGYTGRVSATDPLLRTGELRASIKSVTEHNAVVLGTDDPVAVFHEYGTTKMPPRPFISTTMFREGKPAAELVYRFMIAALCDDRQPPKPKPDHHAH